MAHAVATFHQFGPEQKVFLISQLAFHPCPTAEDCPLIKLETKQAIKSEGYRSKCAAPFKIFDST
jgi:hypothetical protein